MFISARIAQKTLILMDFSQFFARAPSARETYTNFEKFSSFLEFSDNFIFWMDILQKIFKKSQNISKFFEKFSKRGETFGSGPKRGGLIVRGFNC